MRCLCAINTVNLINDECNFPALKIQTKVPSGALTKQLESCAPCPPSLPVRSTHTKNEILFTNVLVATTAQTGKGAWDKTATPPPSAPSICLWHHELQYIGTRCRSRRNDLCASCIGRATVRLQPQNVVNWREVDSTGPRNSGKDQTFGGGRVPPDQRRLRLWSACSASSWTVSD